MEAKLEQGAKNYEWTLTVSVPSQRLDDLFQKHAQELSRSAKLPGFRPGKVPLKAIKQHYGARILKDVVRDAMQESYAQALTEHKLTPVAPAMFDIKEHSEGGDLVYDAKFDVYPEVEVKGLDKVEIERPVCEVSEENIDQMLQTLCKLHTKYEESKQPVKTDDKAVIAFKGMIDGEEFDGGTADDFEIVIGSGNLINGFEEGLIGLNQGDKKTLKLEFPEKYHLETLAGKPVEFDVEVKQVLAPQVPEINDEMAKQFGVDSVEALRTEVKNNMLRELDIAIKSRLKNQVVEGILAQNGVVDVPSTMIAMEVQQLRQNLKSQLQGSGREAANVDNLGDDMFESDAKKRVAIGLLLNRIMRDEEINLDQSQVETVLDQMTAVYEDKEKVKDQIRADNRQMAEVEQIALEEQLISKILEKAKVTDSQVDFFEIVGNENMQA